MINILESNDKLIIKTLGDLSLKNNKIESISFDKLFDLCDNDNLTEDILNKSIEILNIQNYVEYKKFIGGSCSINLTPNGFLLYAENYIANYDQMHKDFISTLINKREENLTDYGIHQETKIPHPLINSLMEYYKNKGYLKLEPPYAGFKTIDCITAIGERFFENELK